MSQKKIFSHLFNTEPRFLDHHLNFPARANTHRGFETQIPRLQKSKHSQFLCMSLLQVDGDWIFHLWCCNPNLTKLKQKFIFNFLESFVIFWPKLIESGNFFKTIEIYKKTTIIQRLPITILTFHTWVLRLFKFSNPLCH